MIASQSLNQASRRITNALFVSQSLFAAAMIASFTLTSIIAADLSGDDKLAGLPSTMSLIGRAAVAYPLGWLMDRLGRRVTVAGGFFFGALGAAISTLAIIWQSFPLFMFGSLIFGMGRASSDQSRYIAAEVQTASNRAKAIGFIVFAGTIGSVLGPRLVAPTSTLAENWGLNGYAGPSLIGVLLTFIAGLIVLAFVLPGPVAHWQDVARARGKVGQWRACGEMGNAAAPDHFSPTKSTTGYSFHAHRPTGDGAAHDHYPVAHGSQRPQCGCGRLGFDGSHLRHVWSG